MTAPPLSLAELERQADDLLEAALLPRQLTVLALLGLLLVLRSFVVGV